MKKYFGYIRVSTLKQGKGVSLQEQKDSILKCAIENNIKIVEWLEEKETAAKQGRPVFSKMVKDLLDGKAEGVIIHKIDRSARNLKDWATIGDLNDNGIDVKFAHESLDLNERGGRLAADIQAVIASDYIRNLREETKKGLYGRLKQGIYPLAAPVGYLDNGGGNLKTIDPDNGPLVKKAFYLYSTGQHSLDQITKIMRELGLRNKNGNKLYRSGISRILNNPFYTGTIRIKDRTFEGNHEPLIPTAIYKRVKELLQERDHKKKHTHHFIFQRMITCTNCGYRLIAEKQKGHVYYRCHTKDCPIKCIKESTIEQKFFKKLSLITFSKSDIDLLNKIHQKKQSHWTSTYSELENSLKLQINKLNKIIQKNYESYLEDLIDKTSYMEKNNSLQMEINAAEEKLSKLVVKKELIFQKAEKYLELLKNPKKSYIRGKIHHKRRLVQEVTSNLEIIDNKPIITIKSPYSLIANRPNLELCALDRTTSRTEMAKNMDEKELEGILEKIYEHVVKYMDAHWERIEDIFFPSEYHD